MPAPRKYSDAQRAEALALYESEGPTAAGKKLGIPKETIMRWAKATGTHTVRNENTRSAVEAKVVDGKLRRQNITHRLYAQAEKMLDDLEAETFRTLVKSTGGSEVEEELGFVPPNDRKTLIQAVGSAMTTTANLAKLDQDNGVGEVVSMLDKLIGNLGVPDE